MAQDVQDVETSLERIEEGVRCGERCHHRWDRDYNRSEEQGATIWAVESGRVAWRVHLYPARPDAAYEDACAAFSDAVEEFLS